MTDHRGDDADMADMTDEMRRLLAAGASDVVEYDYEGGLAAHLAAIGAPVAPAGAPHPAGTAGAAGAGGAAAGFGAAAGSAPLALATGATASKAWIALLALPFTGAVALALWLGGALDNEPGATPEATTAASAALAAAPGSLNSTTPVVAEKGAPPAEASTADRGPPARERRREVPGVAPHRPSSKAAPMRAKSGLSAEPRAPETASADFPEPSAGAPSATASLARMQEVPAAPPEPTPEQRFDDELQRRKRAAAAQEKQTDRLRLEMESLAEAKRALATDPSRAFTIARDGERQFGRSVLSEERQHVLILALLKLGRFADARRVAAPYLQRHPDSPFAKRVQKALEAAGAR